MNVNAQALHSVFPFLNVEKTTGHQFGIRPPMNEEAKSFAMGKLITRCYYICKHMPHSKVLTHDRHRNADSSVSLFQLAHES